MQRPFNVSVWRRLQQTEGTSKILRWASSLKSFFNSESLQFYGRKKLLQHGTTIKNYLIEEKESNCSEFTKRKQHKKGF